MCDPVTGTLLVASTVLGASSAYQQGKAAENAARYQAAQSEDLANLREQEGQREAAEVRRQKAVAISDARAQQAASGGGTMDETALTQTARLGAAYERNALGSIYQASIEAEGLRRRATGAQYEGRVAKQAGTMKALSTVISGAYQMNSMRGTPDA